jgi:hypothetical protein
VKSALRLLLIALALLAALPQPAAAQDEQTYGYFWSLEYTFENDFTGALTVEVGPWESGTLTSVDATSTTEVPCTPVGNVVLREGDAVFRGGHLECEMDIGAIVLQKHGLAIPPVASYRGILFAADLEATVAQPAPIFTHPDAAYGIDFTQPRKPTLTQALQNDLAPQQATFAHVNGFERNEYAMAYGCAWLGPCHSSFHVGPQSQGTPPGGQQIAFSTERQTFLIGADGATTFRGRLGNLLLDPGNTIQ